MRTVYVRSRLPDNRTTVKDRPSSAVVPVLVVAHGATARRLGDILGDCAGFALAGSHGRLEDALPAILAVESRLVLLELGSPRLVDFEAALGSLRRERPSVDVVVLCDAHDPRLPSILLAGAVGHLSRRCSRLELERALATVLAGGAAVDPTVVRQLLESHPMSPRRRPSPAPNGEELTDREREVLAGFVEGASCAALADRLAISPNTVRGYAKALYKKLEVSGRAAAVAKAVREHLV